MTQMILASLGLLMAFSASARTVEERKSAVYSELSKYQSNSKTLPEKYRQSFMNWIEQDLRSIASQLQYSPANCKEEIKVDFQTNKYAETPAVIRDFEKDLIKIDMELCFTNTTPEAVVNLSNSNQFMMKNISTMRAASIQGDMSCHKTQVTSVGQSNYCYVTDQQNGREFATAMTYNVWNSRDKKYDAPVYFRQILLAAKQMGQGKVTFRSVTYVRGPDLNGFQRMFSRGVILNEQKMIYEKMKEELGSR